MELKMAGLRGLRILIQYGWKIVMDLKGEKNNEYSRSLREIQAP